MTSSVCPMKGLILLIDENLIGWAFIVIDNNRNILYTSDTSVYPNITNNVLVPKEPAPATYLDEKDKITKKSNNLGGILDDTSEKFIVNNLRYLMLVITVQS